MAVIDILSESEASSRIECIKETHQSDSLTHPNKEIVYVYKRCSVTDYNLLKKTMEEVIQKFGRLDIIINSAGITNELNPQKVIDINFVRSCPDIFFFVL